MANDELDIDFPGLKTVLYSAVLSDGMDAAGLPVHAMRPFVRPLHEDDVVFGQARTGLFMPRYADNPDEPPYDIEIALTDDLQPGDVVVFACNGPTERIVPWGELLTTAAMQRGATGCVTDGLARDVKMIRRMRFPVFAGGIGVLDSKGRSKMVDRDLAVECAGVMVRRGDLIFADMDGVVVIPRPAARDVIEQALAKIQGENITREEIRRGVPLGQVYAKYGVL
jgi:regulator of RNase E activity RraA